MARRVWWMGTVAVALTMLLAACSGDDNKKDQGASSSASGTGVAATTTAPGAAAAATATSAAGQAQAAGGDCFAGLKSYRYSGSVNVKFPSGAGSQQGGDLKVTGAFVAPDRTQGKVDLGSQTFELVSIGSDVWLRRNNGSWEKNPAEAAGFSFRPADFCQFSPADLQKAGFKGTKESVNGVDAVKYVVTKKDLEKLSGGFEGIAAAVSTLADDLELGLWVTAKEQWPVRITVRAAQTGNDALSLNAEFNVTDFNNSDITIDAPG